MAYKENFEMTGVENILKQLNGLGIEGIKKQKEMLYPAGKYLQEEVQKRAESIDDGMFTFQNYLYGTLPENIWLEWDSETNTTYISSGSAWWAKYIEYGFSNAKTVYRPKPFMEDVLRESKDEIKKLVIKEVKRVMKL